VLVDNYSASECDITWRDGTWLLVLWEGGGAIKRPKN
jgi:hypothetical protein